MYKECPECKAENPVAASFCRHCRYKFDKASKGGMKINPEIKDFRVTELYCVDGVPFDIVWEIENCTRLLLNGIEIPTNLNKKREVISKTTTFTLTAENEYQLVEKTIIITPLPKPLIKSFQASRLKIKKGEKIRLSWKTENAGEIVLQHNNVLNDVSSKEELEVAPTENTTYKLIVYLTGSFYPVEKELTVIVFEKVEIVNFTADKSKILESEKVVLSWDVKNATKVTLQPINKILADNGTFEVWPRVDTNYYIQAENDFFSERKEVSVFVTPLPRFNTNLIPKLDINKIPVMDVDLSVAKPPVRDIQKFNQVHSVLSETKTELYTPLVNIFTNLSDYFKKWKINF